MLGQTILIVDDEPLVAEAIAAALETPRRRIVLCGDIDAAAVVLERFAVSLVITDVRMSHPFGYEGLELLRRVSAMHGTAGVVVMSGMRDPELDQFARIHGAAMFLQKPFELERIESFLASCPEVELPPVLAAASPILRFPDIDESIAGNELGPVFQPIIDLRTGAAAASEALTRVSSASPLHDISLLLSYAERRHRIVDLDLALVARSIRGGAELARRLPLFINVHPLTLTEPDRLIPTLLLHADRAGVAFDSLVIEITEYAALRPTANVVESLEALRGAGVRFALDDVGSAYSHLSLIDTIQPSFLKISQEFGTGFEKDQARARIVKNILQLGHDFGIDAILEGVETSETAVAARDLGFTLAQGYHFARPAPLALAIGLVEAAA